MASKPKVDEAVQDVIQEPTFTVGALGQRPDRAIVNSIYFTTEDKSYYRYVSDEEGWVFVRKEGDEVETEA